MVWRGLSGKVLFWLSVASLPILIITSLSTGAYTKVGISTVITLLSGGYVPKPYLAIILRRALRTLAAITVGIALSSSGLGLQYVLKNPLAEPYLLGISSGAALGVLTTLLLGTPEPYEMFLAAFIGALATFALVLTISSFTGFNPLSVIIAGVATSYCVNAVNIFIMMKIAKKVHGAYFWLFGSVAYVLKDQVIYSLIIASAAIVWLGIRSRAIATLILGEDVAKSLGIRTKLLRAEVIIASSVATSAVVAMAGPVGFVGLAAPWLARLGVGTDFRKSLPASLVAGAAVTTLADLVARSLLSPTEVPLTAVTSLMGTPVLIYLLIKRVGWGRS